MKTMNDIEQEFYDTFGIEPEIGYVCDKEPCEKELLEDKQCKGCSHLYDTREDYPEITAEKLLQLLCIVIDEYNRNGRTFYLDSTNVKELKEDILDALMGCIDVTCDLFETEVKQIQQLFKE